MEIKHVLDKGFVELVDIMGSDKDILETARVSTGSNPSKGDEADRGLIRYLYRNSHLSPFQFAEIKFKIHAPIFVLRQWMRHDQDYNESSARYVELPEAQFYFPDEWRKQGVTNHQGSSDEVVIDKSILNHSYGELLEFAKDNYSFAIENGVAKELARINYPVSMYSTLYAKTNLRNWFHFLELRLTDHAQKEIRVYAEAILQLLKDSGKFKWSIEIFEEEYRLQQIIFKLKDKYKKDYTELENKLKGLL